MARLGGTWRNIPNSAAITRDGSRPPTPPAVVVPKIALNALWVAEGDSITAGSNGPQWIFAAIARTGARLRIPYQGNQATGGQTAEQMKGQVAAIVALAPKLVTDISGTNDLGGTANTPSQIYEDRKTMWKAYIDGGAQYVVAGTVMPRSDTNFTNLGPQREADRQALNALVLGYATDPSLSAYKDKIRVVNLEGFNSVTMAGDKLHPNWLGAIFVGNLMGDAINEIIDQTSRPTDAYSDPANMINVAGRNAALTGTTGTKTGTPAPTGEVASSWSVAHNDAITLVASKDTINGAAAQRIVASGTNTTANRVIQFLATVAYSGVAADQYELCMDFELAAGHAGIRAISLSCDTAMTPSSTSSVVMDGAGALSGTLRTVVTAPLAGVDTSTSVQGVVTLAAGVIAADIKWGRPVLSKIN